MNIIDADWELRNLGISTQEVEISNDDNLESVEQVLSSLSAKYQVIKAPVSRPELYALLSDHRFVFIEELIRCSHDLNDPECPELIKRISNRISFEEMNEEGFREMKEHINSGIFKTDRVYLDPFFTKEQAAKRYIMWMQDEKNRGSIFYRYIYKGRSLGFSCMKENKNNECYPVLGGIYNEDSFISMGSVIVFKQLEIAKSRNGKKLYTYISSNNPSVVRVYSHLGYVIDDMEYVFVKHVS